MGQPYDAPMVSLVMEALDGIGLQIFSEKPFVLFGHSFGAWFAYEMALEFKRREPSGWPQPLKLYVSGNRAPQFAAPENDPDRLCPVLHTLSYQDFWEHFERRYGRNPDLQSDAVKNFAWGILQNDFRMLETYVPTSSEPLGVSLTVLGACGDRRYTPEQIAAWCVHTTGQFQQRWFEGKQTPGYWGTPHR